MYVIKNVKLLYKKDSLLILFYRKYLYLQTRLNKIIAFYKS